MWKNSPIGALPCTGFCLMHTLSKDKEDNSQPSNFISLWNAKKEEVRVSLLGLFCPKLYFLEGSRQNMAETKQLKFHLRILAVFDGDRC